MISALLAAVLTASPPLIEQKRVLDNGAVLYAAAMPDTRGFFLHLFVSSAVGDHRHLIEHLVAKGQNKDIDVKLESRGVFLSAATLNDGIRFEMEGPHEALPAAIEALSELLKLRTISKEEVEREGKIMNEELALRSWNAALTASLWQSAFGETGRDPFGDIASVKNATPEIISKDFENAFVSNQTCVAVVGAFDQRIVLELLERMLAQVPSRKTSGEVKRTLQPPTGEQVVPNASGRARGVVVGSMGKANTLAILAAGFALAADCPGAAISYNPSPHQGVVALLHPGRGGLDDVDRLIDEESARLSSNGRLALLRWIMNTERSPRDMARMNGQMLSGETFFRTEDLMRRAERLTDADVLVALQSFISTKCVRAAGGQR